MKRLAVLPLLAILILGASAGSKTIKNFGRDHMRVDGYELEHRREVEIEGTLENLLEIESALGDIEIVGGTDKVARLRVEIYEYKPDDLEVELSTDGRIYLESEGGYPSAVGSVYAEIPSHLELNIETGMGDVQVADMSGSEFISIETGLGGVTLMGLKDCQRVVVATGKGDIRLGPAGDLAEVELATGMGGIKVKDTMAVDIEASSGMGSIRFLDCDFDYVSGGTGMGSVKFKRSRFKDSDMSSGLGRVTYD